MNEITIDKTGSTIYDLKPEKNLIIINVMTQYVIEAPEHKLMADAMIIAIGPNAFKGEHFEKRGSYCKVHDFAKCDITIATKIEPFKDTILYVIEDNKIENSFGLKELNYFPENKPFYGYG